MMGPQHVQESVENTRCRSERCRSGFTLIEIMVVMAIISMVMLLVIPRLPSSDQENLKISARTLASTLLYMQERAAPVGARYELAIDLGTDSVKILEISASGTIKAPSDPLLLKSVIKEGITVSDVRTFLGKVNDGQLQLAIGSEFITIHLRSPDGKFWTVMSFPSVGKIRAYEGYLEDPP